MLLLTNSRSIQMIIEVNILVLYENLTRTEVPVWDCYENEQRHLSGFLQRVFDLRADLKIDEGIIQRFFKPLQPHRDNY
ncbi:hypothetical protein CEXT_722251 [Caerostris extrusa]|uniref:Uncharacterized protein n=1 Tax=Caerostris extrusa TaxID=172846 RepID=A0AAV4Y5K3_CAEEX|nr:hypothetical protein CEXT_722251 [Caerostris extrusa]